MKMQAYDYRGYMIVVMANGALVHDGCRADGRSGRFLAEVANLEAGKAYVDQLMG